VKKINCTICPKSFDARLGFRVHIRAKQQDRMAFIREHACSEGCARARRLRIAELRANKKGDFS
jgi:hypothetical protein